MTVSLKPTVNPNDREQVVSTSRYRSGQLVWVWRRHDWRRGVVLGASTRAMIVRFHLDGQVGGLLDTDTVTARYVMSRDEVCRRLMHVEQAVESGGEHAAGND